MTQDEVDLIYDYLHENYRYEDGDLLLTKPGNGRKINDKLGCFQHSKTYYAALVVCLNINKKKYHIPLKKLIWIFINKESPKYLYHLDKNITNCKIENLVPSKRKTLPPLINNCLEFRCGKYTLVIREGFKSYYFGRFKEKEEALNLHNKIVHLNMVDNIPLSELVEKYKVKHKSKLPVGVSKSGNGYCATIRENKRKLYLGHFKDANEAHAAYLKAKAEIK